MEKHIKVLSKSLNELCGIIKENLSIDNDTFAKLEDIQRDVADIVEDITMQRCRLCQYLIAYDREEGIPICKLGGFISGNKCPLYCDEG